MKTTQQRTGSRGEDMATAFLQKEGYRILERNWRAHGGEIDIIAMDGAIMVFAEVKTRSYLGLRTPEESVTFRKWEVVARAAHAFMEQSDHNWEVRFDIIAITLLPDEEVAIDHYQDVYFPGR